MEITNTPYTRFSEQLNGILTRSETMSKREKRLEKARNNPKNVTFEELVTLLESYGFQKAHGEGSHVTYWYNQGGLALRITIVYRRPHVKPVYVEEVIEKIDRVKEQAGE